MAGVRIPPGAYTVAPTPPPEVDVEAWLDSVDAIEAIGPQRLRARGGDREAFLTGLEREVAERAVPAAARSLREASPPEQLWLGLERYWRKRSPPRR